jgi:predicted aminopeptidase
MALLGAALAVSADARYLARAGVAEAGILWRAEPIERLVSAPGTDSVLRGKLLLVLAVRAYAAESLGLAAGETYTTYSALDRDTLVLVLSAAPADRLEPYTWRYPIVGRVPYKGFFSSELASREARKLERAGLDTYLRPAGAFSTLGWFNDPLLSTMVDADSADLAATVIHEILHNTIYLPGRADFNESFAEFTGYRGAEAFFRSRGDTANAARALARWRDLMRLARFYDLLVRRLERVYAAPATPAQVRQLRSEVFQQAARDLEGPLARTLTTIDARRLARQPLNNAVLVARRIYGRELDRFDLLLARQGGGVRAAIELLRVRSSGAADPWAVLDTLAPRPRPAVVDSVDADAAVPDTLDGSR